MSLSSENIKNIKNILIYLKKKEMFKNKIF